MAIGKMKTSQKGIDMIKGFEGFRAQSYRCVITEKYLTIGYGHYGPDVKMGQVITKAQGEELLKKDLIRFEACVNKYDHIYDFNQNEFDALVSFAVNIGNIDQLTSCGTRSRKVIAEKMLLYVNSGGKKLQGLVNRRKAEHDLFLSNSASTIELAQPTLRIRCKSDKVKILQHSLNTLFGTDLVIDGSYGKLTKAAVEKAQDIMGITIDGIYGPQTYASFQKRAQQKGYRI